MKGLVQPTLTNQLQNWLNGRKPPLVHCVYFPQCRLQPLTQVGAHLRRHGLMHFDVF